MHITDQATDIGGIMEFHNIAKSQRHGCNFYDIDIQSVFYCSIVAFVQYRIISAIAIYIFTRNWLKALRQLFDLEIYKLKKKKKNVFSHRIFSSFFSFLLILFFFCIMLCISTIHMVN